MSGSRRKPGPLGPFVDGYRAWLIGRGYSPSVVVRSLITLGHLGRWLERNALAVDQLTAKAMSSFLAEYRVDRGRLPGASVWPLLEFLRAEGCPSAALLDEIARRPAATRQVFTDELMGVIDDIASRLDPTDPESARTDALTIFGMMIGTLQLARALTDRDLSDQLLARGVETAVKLLDDRA